MSALLFAAALPLAIAASVPLSADTPPTPSFAAPVRLKAGDAFLGEDRLFPSPVFHDVNGDGLLDIVVGDLPGRLTVALREKGTDARAFAAETQVMASDGKRIDFHNW
jgi:hypothetical protein